MDSLSRKLIVLCLWAGVTTISGPVSAVDIPTNTSAGTWDPVQRVYTLDRDVELADDSLNIVEDDLTLNGAGHTLTGTGVYDWDGVCVAGRNHVTIQGLAVTGFYRGIGIYGTSSHITITGNTVADNEEGINAMQSSDITVADNTASHNSLGIGFWMCTNNVVTGNTASDNVVGIDINAGCVNSILTDNTASFNLEEGIWLAACTDTTLTGNTASYNNSGNDGTRAGIRVGGSCENSTLTRNTITGNGGHGILVHDSSGNVVENNFASENKMTGIHIATGSHDNQVRYNTSISNGGGIYIIGYPAVDSLCRTDVTGNTASGNTETGISVFLCSDILITGNTCERNGKTGIGVGQAADTTVSDNTALDNLEGISVYGALGSSILNNVVSQGVCGIVVHVCDNITVEDNTVSSNTELGIQLAGRVYGTFTGNTVSDNGTGIELIGCQDSAIYNNNFIANTTQVAVTAGSTGNLFNLDRPIGGNFWSDWTGPDADGDGFVDNPYVFTGGQDNLPLADQSSWLLQELMTQITSLNLPDGIENSLNAKLRAAMQELGEGNTAAAIESLEALIHEAEAQRGKAIRTDDADALIAAVQEIISALSGT